MEEREGGKERETEGGKEGAYSLQSSEYMDPFLILEDEVSLSRLQRRSSLHTL